MAQRTCVGPEAARNFSGLGWAMKELNPFPFFFKLPRELRDVIYELLLIERQSWAVSEGFQYIFPKALLLASRQLNEEASKVFYGNNTLRLEIGYDWRLPEAALAAYRGHSVRRLEMEIRIDTQNPETDYERLAPFYAPFPELPSLCAGIRKNVQMACEIISHGPRLRRFTLEWWDKQESGAWSTKRLVLEPLTLLRGVDEVQIDRGWDIFKINEEERPGGNSAKDSDFEWLKTVMELDGLGGEIQSFDERDSRPITPSRPRIDDHFEGGVASTL